MKHRSSLVLMELLIMTAVFALAAALCLQIFAEADRISRDTLSRDKAVRICENTAEAVKAAGNVSAAAHALGATKADGCWQLPLEEAGEGFLLEMEERNAPVPGMGAALIRVLRGSDKEPLFQLTVGYQEVAP